MKGDDIMIKDIIQKNFTCRKKLADFLLLDEQARESILPKSQFPLNLPFRLAQKIQKGTLDDPILKQFLPTHKESIKSSGFLSDPVNDVGSQKTYKLLHKYHGRVLLVCTSACAMHCRYCFRQNFDYEVKDKTYQEELDYIKNDSSIREVILSGGDPLSLPNRVLGNLLKRLSEIKHVKNIRFHTRYPIGIPERIDDPFLTLLEEIPQQIWFVIHCNHPRELDDEIFYRLAQLRKIGVMVLNQAVLLKGVNDNVDVLKELCETLIDHGILPYYLHQLDRVQGAGHFEVSEEEGLRLINELRGVLPGYAVPRYVREIAGEKSKTELLKNKWGQA